MIRDPAINLLIIGLSDGDSEQIITAFRKAGRVTHTERISDNAQLDEALRKSEWHLIILDERTENLSLEQCSRSIAQSGSGIPILMVSEGAADHAIGDPDLAGVFAHHELHHLCRAALREIAALQTRREMTELQTALEEARQRNELLLSDHSDPVCYITDGMIIHANPQFCERLGIEELDGFPIVDLLANKDQERFKNLLKKQAQSPDQQRLELNFVQGDGGEFTTLLCCDNASYDGEKCIQLTLQSGETNANEGQLDANTGFSNRNHFRGQLQDFLEHQRNSNGALMLVAIDHFARHRQGLGLQGSEQLAQQVGQQVQQRLSYQHIGRVADDMFAVVASHMPSNEAMQQAEDLLQATETQVFEINKKSLQCTLSAAIFPINHLTAPDANEALSCCFGYLTQISGETGNCAGIYTKERQQLSRNESIDDMISEAFADQRFRLLFQPMINLGDAQGDHYEVFLDIKNWQEGEVTAGEVMRVIERDPLNNKLDRWIIIEATRLLAQKQLNDENTKLVINLSSNVFHDVEFCAWLGVALKAAGLADHSLTLQFSEESIANSLKPAIEFSRQVSELGLGISVRNFGRYEGGNKFLHQIGPSLVKPGARKSDSLSSEDIRSFIQLARTLNSRILIPNVTSASILAALWQLGPDFIEGSYVHEPLPSMDYEFSAFS